MNREENKRITVIVKVTSSCNLNCPYCYTRSTIKQGNPYMTIETFEKIIQNVSTNYDRAIIIFHGGEPTLLPLEWYKEAIECINKYKKLYNISFKLNMQTNLTLFDEEKFKFFADNDINIGFSYDGMTNDLTRKNDDVILNNYRRYVKLSNKRIGAICLITANNYRTLEKDFILFEKLNLRAKFNIVFNTVTMDGDLVPLDMSIIVKNFEWLFKRVCSVEKHPLERVFCEYIGYICNNRQYITLCTRQDCRTKWISVQYNGDLYPCGQEWGQKNKKYLLGNINTHTFEEAFNDEPFKIFSNKIQTKMDRCRETCEIFDFCNGGCPGETFSNMGDVDMIDVHNCNFEKEMIKMLRRVLSNQHVINKTLLTIIRGSDDTKRHY